MGRGTGGQTRMQVAPTTGRGEQLACASSGSAVVAQPPTALYSVLGSTSASGTYRPRAGTFVDRAAAEAAARDAGATGLPYEVVATALGEVDPALRVYDELIPPADAVTIAAKHGYRSGLRLWQVLVKQRSMVGRLYYVRRLAVVVGDQLVGTVRVTRSGRAEWAAADMPASFELEVVAPEVAPTERPARRKIPEATPEELDRIVAILKEHDDRFLSDPVHGYHNPFARSGLTAAFVAAQLDWWLGDPARHRPDTARARRALKVLVESGRAASGGSQRTLAAGSKHTEVFTGPDFRERLLSVEAQARAEAVAKAATGAD